MMIRLSRQQRDKVDLLGGAAWIRAKIDDHFGIFRRANHSCLFDNLSANIEVVTRRDNRLRILNGSGLLRLRRLIYRRKVRIEIFARAGILLSSFIFRKLRQILSGVLHFVFKLLRRLLNDNFRHCAAIVFDLNVHAENFRNILPGDLRIVNCRLFGI